MNLSLNVLCFTGEMRPMPKRFSPCLVLSHLATMRAFTHSLIAFNFGQHCSPFQLKFSIVFSVLVRQY